MNETSRKGQEATTETKASPVAPRDHNSGSGIHPMPTRTMQDLAEHCWIDASVFGDGEILIVHRNARDTAHRLLNATDAIEHGRNIFMVATTALHERSPVLAEQFARAFAAELLALADAIGVAAMTPEDRRQKALDER